MTRLRINGVEAEVAVTTIAELLAERFDCSNIPIDDQYLFVGLGGKHAPHH